MANETLRLVEQLYLWKIIFLKDGEVVVNPQVVEAWKGIVKEISAGGEFADPELAAMAFTIEGYLVLMFGKEHFTAEEFEEHMKMAALVLEILNKRIPPSFTLVIQKLQRRIRIRKIRLFSLWALVVLSSFMMWFTPSTQIWLYLVFSVSCGLLSMRGTQAITFGFLCALIGWSLAGLLISNPFFGVALIILGGLMSFACYNLKQVVSLIQQSKRK